MQTLRLIALLMLSASDVIIPVLMVASLFTFADTHPMDRNETATWLFFLWCLMLTFTVMLGLWWYKSR